MINWHNPAQFAKMFFWDFFVGWSVDDVSKYPKCCKIKQKIEAMWTFSSQLQEKCVHSHYQFYCNFRTFFAQIFQLPFFSKGLRHQSLPLIWIILYYSGSFCRESVCVEHIFVNQFFFVIGVCWQKYDWWVWWVLLILTKECSKGLFWGIFWHFFLPHFLPLSITNWF